MTKAKSPPFFPLLEAARARWLAAAAHHALRGSPAFILLKRE